MKILITGGSGFIGSHVVEHYQNRAEIIVLDNLRSGHRRNLDGLKCHFIEGSILDRTLLDEIMPGVDFIIHLAALVSVPESMAKPLEAVDLNVNGLLNVLEAARMHRVKKLAFASSAAVYGENPIHPKVETLVPDPRSPYAISKLDGEYYCALYNRENWLQTTCLRFFNVFGPRQDPHSAYAAAVPIFLQCAKEEKPICIYGDGSQTRDFVYVNDIAGALSFALENEHVDGVFNTGYGHSISILELAKKIIKLTNSSSEIKFLPSRPGDIRHSMSDPSKLLAAGWKPRFNVTSGLANLIENQDNTGFPSCDTIINKSLDKKRHSDS